MTLKTIITCVAPESPPQRLPRVDIVGSPEFCDNSLMMSESLFDRLGGLTAVSRIVLSFYDHVLESERLEPFFGAVDMRRIVDHQSKFIASLIGGPASYTDDELREIHAGLGIDSAAFREMMALFRQTLVEHDLEPADIEAIMTQLEGRERYIVGGGSTPGLRVA